MSRPGGAATAARAASAATRERAPKRLVLADPVSPEGLELLHAAEGLILDDRTSEDRAGLKRALQGAHGLIVRSRTQVDADLLETADALEVIGRAGVGVDNIDLETATRRGIAVLNAPGGNTFSTAELTLALLLAVARRVPEADGSVREGRWERKRLRGVQLQGKTLGVIGAGRIGTEVARRARAFGMRVVICDPYLTPDRAADLGLKRLEVDELLATSDAVTLHVPLTPTTERMIGAPELARMREGAILLNAARGGLVDEVALAEALKEGRLAGAGLDVFEDEPLPGDSPLRSAPNVVFTPHIGAATAEAQREVSREISAAVRDALLHADYRSALNAPYVEVGDRQRLEPVLELGRRLGVLLAELTDGRCDRVEVRYAGEQTNVLRPLAAAAVEGYLRGTVDRPLNLVNALSLAAERGIEVGRVRLGETRDYSIYVELRARSELPSSAAWTDAQANETTIGGALLGEGLHARVVRIGDFHLDAVPEGVLLLVRNRDVPGVIGEVGTRLGASGINIAEYHQSRRAAGAEALGLISVDEPAPEAVLDALRGLTHVEEVRQVEFGP